jgi:UDP-glucose 4-epimerase
MSRLLDLFLAECNVPIEVISRTERMRPADAGAVVSNSEKVRRETGWYPRYDLRQTLRDTLDSWRQSISDGHRATLSVTS